jgi:hypothetical protein
MKEAQPKRLLCGLKTFEYLNKSSEIDLTLGVQIEPVLAVGSCFEIVTTSDSSFYIGKCGAKLASEIELTEVGSAHVSRLPAVCIEMKDSRYHMTSF